MSEIILAKTAGFCFGVNRAVALCEKLIDEGKSVATLGPIIHNSFVVESLKNKGAIIVERPEDTPKGYTLVIRSHGVAKAVYDNCKREGITIADATCPFVSKIHDIVREYSEKGYEVLIAGDKNHPEVEGIVGHCEGETIIYADLNELKALLNAKILTKNAIMVAQTTFNLSEYNKCCEYIKKIYTNVAIFDTICNATRERQQEAEKLALKCDVCVVIGGQNSSNTKKLRDVCSLNATTFSIENKDGLTEQMLSGAKSIGVTAGASTPSPLIEEVLTKMSEIIKDEDFNFEQALEDSLKLVHRGQRVEGIVTSIKPNEVVVDIGTKHTGFIPIDELSDDASLNPNDIVKVGDKLMLLVTKVQDLEGFVTLSKKRIDSEKGLEEIEKGVEDGTVFDAYISEAVNKGLVAIVKGVRIFIPASQATVRRGEPYEQLVRTHQKIKILEVNQERRRAIGSIRAVLDIENDKKREEFWKDIEVGKKFQGAVKSITSYGAFVDLGGVDGMVHISELSWGRLKSPADVLKVGDVIDVYVKDVDLEKKKISLGYRKEEDNPWKAIQNYKIGEEFEAPVVSLTKFGAFVRILPGIDGLVHVSEMSSEKVSDPAEVVKVGDKVKVRLIGVDLEKKRVSLSMRPDGEELSDSSKREKAFDETLSEAGKFVKDVAVAAAQVGDNLVAKTKEAVEKATPKVEALGDDIAETAKDTGKKLAKTAKDASEKLAETAKDAGEKLAETAKDTGKKLAKTAKDAGEKLADKAKDAVETVKDKLDGDDEK